MAHVRVVKLLLVKETDTIERIRRDRSTWLTSIVNLNQPGPNKLLVSFVPSLKTVEELTTVVSQWLLIDHALNLRPSRLLHHQKNHHHDSVLQAQSQHVVRPFNDMRESI